MISDKKSKNVCFFLSASNIPEKYQRPAIKLIELSVKEGYNFVYGGSDEGLMKMAADIVRKNGGRIILVVTEEFRNVRRKDVDELIECPNILYRKREILEVSDAIVTLVGGSGTLDEFAEVIEYKKQSYHNKPLLLLNTDGYKDGLIEQFKKMYEDGFINKPLEDLVVIEDEPSALFLHLKDVLK